MPAMIASHCRGCGARIESEPSATTPWECPQCGRALAACRPSTDPPGPLDSHLQLFRGIGPKGQEKLRQAGVRTWRDLATPAAGIPLSPAKRRTLACEAAACLDRLEAGDARFFHEKLAARERWRLFPHFRRQTAYLDIETTGLSPGWDEVTTIALYDGTRIRCYVNGKNLDEFPADIAAYDLLVTYNGTQFDLPFLKTSFGAPLQQAHIDLRFVLAAMGFKGGLKTCERLLGLKKRATAGIDGFAAVQLWREYRRTRRKPLLETLLAYNVEDTVILERLLAIAHNRAVESDNAPCAPLALPDPPANPFRADPDVVRRFRSLLY